MQNFNSSSFSQVKANQAIERLRSAIVYYEINLEQLFNKFNSQNDKVLDFIEFSELLSTIDRSLNEEDIANAFFTFDKDQSGTISLEEFREALRIPGQEDSDQKQNQLAQQGIKKIQLAIKLYKISIPELFLAYDQELSNSLSFKEFSLLLTKIDPTITQEECQACFRRFDTNRD